MPKATHEPTTPTRRRALRFGASAALAGLVMPAVAKAASGSDADAELIAACGQALRAEQRLCFIDEYGVSDEECKAACELWDTLFTKLAGMPATTPAGIQAKAILVRAAILREAIHSYSDCTAPDEVDVSDLPIDGQLAISFCQDVMAWSGVA